MEIAKDTVVGALRARGEHDRAQLAQCALPRHVDPARDAQVLHHQLGVDLDELLDGGTTDV